jgi:hypothetical protein
MRKLANIARRVFGNSVQVSYFERFHWSILNWSCDSPDFLITPGIRIPGTGADTFNSVQASYFERFQKRGEEGTKSMPHAPVVALPF